ncbi:MAG: phage tail tape measure protein, partial [Neisseriaceae bacterium]|nr:phage tail tape measure protein [Neisseriaceae bacterium]
MAVDVGSAVGYLDLDISKFLASLNQANTEAQNKTKNLGNTLGDGLKTVGDKITGAGKTLTVGLTTPIIGAGVAAVKTTADFDKSMSQVKAVSGATGKDFDALRAKAREMGATTKFSASDAADAMNYMAMAGWKSNDMLGGISGIMDLAAASGEDLATTSDIVTDALTAFGKSADDSGHLADVMAAASSNANTNVSMLGESFKYVAPVAGAMKYSMEDTSIALGLMANAGIKASQGGTSLRTVLTNLAKPTDEMAQAMDDLGVSLQNDDGSMKSLREVMVDLRKGFGDLKVSPEELTEGLGKLDEALANGEITQDEYNEQVERWINKTFKAEDALKAQTAATLAGKTGMSGLLAIVNASEEDFNKLTNAVDNSKGAAHDMSEIMMDNLGGQLQIVKSGLEELAISFGDIMMPAIRDFGSFIQGLVDKLNGLDENQKQMILTIGMVVAAVGPLLLILGSAISIAGGLIKDFNAISEAVTKVKDGFGLLQTVLPTITGPMIAVAAVVGVLVAAF